MKNYLWPWQSHIMTSHPLAMPITFILLALLLSMISWLKKK